MQNSHNESRNESAKKPFRTRSIGIAGLVLAGMVGLTLTGITTASAAASTSVDKYPAPEDPTFVTRGHVDGSSPYSKIEAVDLATGKSSDVCHAAGFDDYTVAAAGAANVFEEDYGVTAIYSGSCTG